MIDSLYSRISDGIDFELYEKMRTFHVLTNNSFFDRLPPLFQQPASEELIQDMVYSDPPLTPFDQNIPCQKPQNRASLRETSAEQFGSTLIHEKTVHGLLWDAFAQRNPGTKNKNAPPVRPYPSGGALYGVQVIVGLLPSRLEKTKYPSGFYHYRPQSHSLNLLRREKEEDIVSLFMHQETRPLHRFSFCFFYVAFFAKTMVKYGLRGYRLAIIESGMMAQQALLTAQNLGLQERVWGHFDEHHACHKMGLSPDTCFPLMAHLFGAHDV